MALSLHKLTAGTGYTYLTRQVAAHDRAGGPRTTLATYYSERGETPGRWVGSGIAGIDGLAVGDEVTAPQMRLLFGFGLSLVVAPLTSTLMSSVPVGNAGLASAINNSISRVG